MKRLLAVLCICAMLATMAPLGAYAAPGESVDFVVLSTTDMHGKCWDKNVLTDANETNNMLRVSTAVKGYRESYGENLLLIDNGDAYQGTPVSVVQLNQITAGESDLPAAMALCFAEIGYDAAVLGNHEFNYPWATMSGIYAYLADRGVQTVTANLYYDGTDGVHEAGENVFTPYIVKTVTIGGTEHKIGVLGFENTDCTRWDIPDNYPGIQFSHPDNPERSIAWEAQRYIPMMQAEGCEFIIVSYHSGTGAASGELVFGVNTEGQVTRMIAECEGIDMVIAGHDHSSSYSNTYIKDKNGKDVLVVNGGGKDLTQSIFTFTEEDGKLVYTVKESRNLSLSAYAVDAALKEKLQPYADLATAYVNQAAGTAVGTWDTSSNYYLQQTDTMDLINGAQIDYGTKYMALKYNTDEKRAALYEATGLDHIEVDMSSTSAVTQNNYYVHPGPITMKTIVQMYKYDNNVLYLLPLTGQQIKDILEQNASTRLKAIVKNGTVTYSTIGEDFTNPVFGGLNFTYDMYQPAGSRVIITGFSNGREFDLAKTYVVACNSYHLGNAGCGFGNYTTTDSIWNQNDDLAGGNVQEVLFEYISDKGEISTEPFTWSWKLDYTGDLDAPTALEGDLAAQKTDAIADGDEIVIYYDAEATVIGSDPAENDARLAAVDTTSYKDFIAFSDKAAVFTVETVEGENDPFLLKTDKGYLTAGDTGNSLRFAAEPTDCSKWYLVPVEGGFHVMNVGANYNGNYNQALEWYTGFTTYGVKDTSAYLFNLYRTVEAGRLADTLKDGGRYVIYLDQEELCVGAEENNGGLAAIKNEISGSFLLPPVAEGTLVVTANIDEEDRIDFTTEDGRHLTAPPSGNGLSLTDEPAANDCSLWKLVAVDGGWHVMSVGANYNGNYNQALEFYSGKFTTYGVKDTGAYLFNFYELPEAAPAGMQAALITDGAPAQDGAFNEAVYDAAAAWCEANGWDFQVCVPDPIDDFSCDYNGAVEAAVADGCSVLLMPGYVMAAPAVENAPKYPDVRFVLFDVSASDLQEAAEDEDYVIPANVYAATYREEQAGYLAGYAAVSLGYDKLAFLGGMAIPAVMRYGYGFVQGANAAAAELGRADAVSVDYACCDQFWSDDTLTAFVEGWYEAGTEAVFACGGGIYVSVLEAASGHDGKFIGVDIDQGAALEADYPGLTLTSAVKGLGATATAQLDRILAGTFVGGQAELLGVVSADPAENFVGIAPTTQFGEGFTEADYTAILGMLAAGTLTVSDDVGTQPETEIEVCYQCYPACDWNEPTYQWAEDCSTVTAARVCRNDESHVETETVETVSEIVPATCTEAGSILYTATFENPAFAAQRKMFVLPMIAHNFVNGVCTVCGAQDPSYVPPQEFSDVAPGDWYSAAVAWAVAKGVTSGTGNGRFSPEMTCSRAQVVTFLWRASGSPAPKSSENPFSDVPNGQWFTDAVLWAVENEITSGTGGGRFSPDAPCTRAQVVTFMWRAKGKPAPASNDNPFSDAPNGEWFTDAVLWAVEQEITTGTGGGKFSPDMKCSRAQIVTFLYRDLGKEEPEQPGQPEQPEQPGGPGQPGGPDQPEQPIDPSQLVEVDERSLILFDLLNERRVQENGSSLAFNTTYYTCAQIRAEEVMTYNSNTRPNGKNWSTVFADSGVESPRLAYEWRLLYQRRYFTIEKCYIAYVNGANKEEFMNALLNEEFTDIAIALFDSPEYISCEVILIKL